MNENFEKYIKDLSPELQEKARQCKTKEDLNSFIRNNDLELPEEALEMVSGGCGCFHSDRTVIETKGAPAKYYGERSLRWEKSTCNGCGKVLFRYYVADGNFSMFITEEQYNNNYSPVYEKNYI